MAGTEAPQRCVLLPEPLEVLLLAVGLPSHTPGAVGGMAPPLPHLRE